MTAPTLEWYKEQSERCRWFYDWLQAVRPGDAHDWKVVALFYSILHRINYWLVRQTGRDPRNHAERNRRVENELPQVFDDYRNLYMMSMQARYYEGFDVTDDRRKSAYEILCRIEKALPF